MRDMKRSTFYIDFELYRAFKIHAVNAGLSMSKIMCELIKKYLADVGAHKGN